MNKKAFLSNGNCLLAGVRIAQCKSLSVSLGREGMLPVQIGAGVELSTRGLGIRLRAVKRSTANFNCLNLEYTLGLACNEFG